MGYYKIVFTKVFSFWSLMAIYCHMFAVAGTRSLLACSASCFSEASVLLRFLIEFLTARWHRFARFSWRTGCRCHLVGYSRLVGLEKLA